MDELRKYVPNVHFELIPIKNLVSNQDYQRTISVKRVKQGVENFDLYKVNPVKISQRDGQNYVIDGQHTIEMVATVSGSRDTPVWCMIYDDMDYILEADLFARQQDGIKPPSPYEIFNANIEAQNNVQLMIKDLVESFGLRVTSTKATGGICAISSLESIYKKYGFEVLDRTLNLCVGTWESEPNSLSASMLKGIAMLVNAYGDELRNDIFKDKLGSLSAKEIIRLAKERRSGSMGYAEAMLTEYNKKMKYGLSWVKLHEKNDKKSKSETIEDDYEENPFAQGIFEEQSMVNFVSSNVQSNDEQKRTTEDTPFQQSL